MTDSNQFNIEFSGHVTIEKMFDIHDNQNVQIINNIKNDEDPKSDFKAPENKENTKVGARKQLLFIQKGTNVENTKIKEAEKTRLVSYLKEHKLYSRNLSTVKSDELNMVIVTFLKIWMDEKLISPSPSAGAVFRFLKEDCGLSTCVTEKSYTNKMNLWLKTNDWDIATYRSVRAYF